MLPHRGEVERPVQAQGPGERPPLLGEVEAPGVGVHAGAPARQSPFGVGGECTPGSDDAQQVGLRRLDPAADARALRAREASRRRAYRVRRLGPPAHGSPGSPSAAGDVPSVSLWMSIRQPVSRAARRAFWPSLPMASDSW